MGDVEGYGLDVPSPDLAVVELVATASSPCRKGPGNLRPRRSARWRIPAQAFGLKKYSGNTAW